MKKCLAALIIAVAGIPSIAQTAEEQGILQPVNRLFQGMKTGDSAMVHSTFTRGITFVTIDKDKSDRPIIKRDAVQGFLSAVGTPHNEVWSEMTWDTQVRSDGNFAQVWTNYGFYLGNKFSHCGVDAFNLFKGPDGSWRIFHLADTRRREGCQVPASISDQFK